ncbi:MAG TPA: S-adenosylmethionine decarboxylase [Terriglobales bacterium]|jgi:S-adenosylmethionine decarboxylase|nr:S-adenosylmethionine decarboxylase [Terriglobales bacterium]
MNGIEWVVDAQGCSSESLQDLERLRRLFDTLILDLHLRPVGATQWHQFPGSGGITGLCLLSESHLACHTFPEHGSLCLNVFCCVPRDLWDFESRLEDMFSATSVQVREVERSYSREDALAPVTGGRAQ